MPRKLCQIRALARCSWWTRLVWRERDEVEMSCDDIDPVSCELFMTNQKPRFPQEMTTHVGGARRAMRPEHESSLGPGAGLVLHC